MSGQSENEQPGPPKYYNEKGEMQRPQSIFRRFISSEPGSLFPPEIDRYHLYVSYACPWAHRTLIVRKLKGLEEILPVTSVHYHLSLSTSWRFVAPDEQLPGPDCTPDPLHPAFKNLSQLYFAADPQYPGRFTVPVLWDKKLHTVVSNESSEIIRMMYTAFDAILPESFRRVDLYPVDLRADIDAVNEWMYDHINNGVYKCGLAKTQSAYKTAVDKLFAHLDRVESHLSSPSHPAGPFYYGASISEVDVRLYVTIVRFDTAYVSLFKTNRNTIRHGYPAIHRWLKNLYWTVPEFNETTLFEHIKGHYFMSLTMLNPSGVVPDGPVPHVEALEE